MHVFLDVLIGFDSVVSLGIVCAAVAGYRAMIPHIKEFKQFTQMMGMGKK